MEKKENDDRFYFEDFCKKAGKASLSMRTLVDKRLNSEKLTVKERPGRISMDIKLAGDDIIAFDRPEYMANLHDIDRLYELFKSRGILYNTEELHKLQKAMNHYEKFTWLQIALINANIAKKAEEQMEGGCSQTGNKICAIDALTFDPVIAQLNDSIHLVKDPNHIGNFCRAVTCNDFSQLTEKVYYVCKVNELKCVIDELFPLNNNLIYANIGKCGLFVGKKGKCLTAHHLTTSSYKKLKTRALIQNILANYHKRA